MDIARLIVEMIVEVFVRLSIDRWLSKKTA
jgi:hypothetical protein